MRAFSYPVLMRHIAEPYPVSGLVYERGLPWRGTLIDCVRIMPQTEYKRLIAHRATLRRIKAAEADLARATDAIGEGAGAVHPAVAAGRRLMAGGLRPLRAPEPLKNYWADKMIEALNQFVAKHPPVVIDPIAKFGYPPKILASTFDFSFNQWIPVSEELLKEDGKFWAWAWAPKTRVGVTLVEFQSGAWWEHKTSRAVRGVTHYMKINAPKPPVF